MVNQEIKYWYLRNHKLFRVLSNSDIKDLCISFSMLKAVKGDYIYLPTDSEKIFIVKKGAIKIVTEDEKGNEVTKDMIMEGDIMGELSGNLVLNNKEFAIAASKEVILCAFSTQNFENLLASKPELGLTYYKWMGLKISKLKMRYSDLVNKDVKTRLKNFIENWKLENGKQLPEGNWQIKNFLTQKDLAGIIGATRQTVVGAISDLEKENYMQYGREFIIVQ